MFKFNFEPNDDTFDTDDMASDNTNNNHNDNNNEPVEPFSQVHLPTLAKSLPSSLLAESIYLPGMPEPLLRRHLADVRFQVAADDETLGGGDEGVVAVSDKSDLIPGIYEGGLKTWECSVDLARYLTTIPVPLTSPRILELGCGSALPSLYALGHFVPETLDLQDYNEQVLALVTLPNLLLNLPSFRSGIPVDASEGCVEIELEKEGYVDGETGMELDDDVGARGREDRIRMVEELGTRCRLFKGDWDGLARSLTDVPDSHRYDLVLTSETVYSPTSISRLCHALRASLRPPSGPSDAGGIALVAAKTFYFGVGGGTRLFCQEIEKDCEIGEGENWKHTWRLRCETVWDTSSGNASAAGLRREIIRVGFVRRDVQA